ncbi:hypothetical protein GCM10023092_19820 [Rurimicrobium arvi]|uniref:Prolyl-tRNA synthetase n=2 Tax=Rurimicrobium arvi TaxID=2049916 RepID=A0ABP8MW10_9BACT
MLTAVLGLTLATGAQAQSGNTYQDDIYSNGPVSSKHKKDRSNYQSSDASDYDRPSDDNFNNNTSAYSGDNYVDYNDDDNYYYSSSINRFGSSSFYARPYFSTFSNPYWYNPYWVDPYWGWSPWNNVGVGISFGGGPYWSSYWGWQNWYGYSPFNSFYYPSYYGGWGYSNWGCGGYYGSYWNGYYAGLYSGYNNGWGGAASRGVTYGPRFSMNNIANNNIGRTYNSSVPGGGRMSGAIMRNAGPNSGMNVNPRQVDNQSSGMRPRGGFFGGGNAGNVGGGRQYNNYNDVAPQRSSMNMPSGGGRPAMTEMGGRGVQNTMPDQQQGGFRSRPADAGFERQSAPSFGGGRGASPSFNSAPARGFGGGGGGGGRMGGFGGGRR